MYRDMSRFGKKPNVVTLSKPKTLFQPFKWNRKKALVFVCSWSDFFIEEADEWRPGAWKIIKETPNLTYQILTKRPERIKVCLPEDWDLGYKNVWLGVSAENQERADERIASLIEIPTRVIFVSLEPMLESINLFEYISCLGWVITGGESGHQNDRRIADMDWFREVRNLCLLAGVPYFHKQHGGRVHIDGAWGGRELDGRTWDEMPKI